ncbi:Aggrecan core protein [Collichthys lucidus]|uniref:Aggrecan core protein n=1 Tax=Collichthys lucidus TaxID=240159 RepID=A0A4U5U3W7_COLLU|nr:Aggrecan core protein [Collichthys lucidus]
MERSIFLIFLCTTFEGNIGEHIFFPEQMAWDDAKAFCLQCCTDLSFISSQRQQDKLQSVAEGIQGWIGLYRNPQNVTVWKWSGGADITYQNWAKGQPDYYDEMEFNAHILKDGTWNDVADSTMPFFCINITTEEGEKTWEEALDHCRKHQTDLISLVSETDHILTQKIFQKVNTERVWIGLRYLGDRWLWVNGDPLVYEAWATEGDQVLQCPILKRCGALTREGLWESWDCQDKLKFICD